MQSSGRVSHNKSFNKHAHDFWDADEQSEQGFGIKAKRKNHDSKRERETYYDKRYFKSETLE